MSLHDEEIFTIPLSVLFDNRTRVPGNIVPLLANYHLQSMFCLTKLKFVYYIDKVYDDELIPNYCTINEHLELGVIEMNYKPLKLAFNSYDYDVINKAMNNTLENTSINDNTDNTDNTDN